MASAEAALESKQAVIKPYDRTKMAECIGIIVGVTWQQYRSARPDESWGFGRSKRVENAARLAKIKALLNGLLRPLDELSVALVPSLAGKEKKEKGGAVTTAVTSTPEPTSDPGLSAIKKVAADKKIADDLGKLRDMLLELMRNNESPPTAEVGGGLKKSSWSDAKAVEEILGEPGRDFYKYNALREEYMARNILTQKVPSIAIMGEAHVGQIKKERAAASFKYYTSYDEFDVKITMSFNQGPATQPAGPTVIAATPTVLPGVWAPTANTPKPAPKDQSMGQASCRA